MTDPSATPSPLVTLRTLARALMGALVLIGIALAFVVEGPIFELGEAWPLYAVIALGLSSVALVSVVGYRTTPIEPGTPADQARSTSQAAYQSAMILRFALLEAPAIIGIALTFVTNQPGLVVYLAGAAIALIAMAIHVLPNENAIARTQESLERKGAASYLREALGA